MVNPAVAVPKRSAANPMLWIAAAGLLVFVFQLLVPHLGAQFVADDFVFLVEDADKPWYFSSDFLYRPVRNLVNHLLPHWLGLSPGGYRWLAAASILATLGAFFVLLRQFGVSKEGSLAAVLVAAFYPRHAMVYYFWAASQDSFMTLFLVVSFVFWIRYRKSHQAFDYLLSLTCFAAGLGFKEPGICFPALLLGWDLSRLGRHWREAIQPTFWRPYIGIVCVVAVFGAFVLWYPQGRFHQPPDRYATYGFFGLGKGVFAWIRTWINLMLPFSRPLALRDLGLAHILTLGLIGGGVFALQRWLGIGRSFLISLAGIAVVNVPTSLFASTNAGDQYLYLPSFFIAGFLGHMIGVLLDKGATLRAVTILALVIYLIAATMYMKGRQSSWKQAGDLVQNTVARIRAVVPPAGLRELTLIGPPGERDNVSVFNNGVLGALVSKGYPADMLLSVTEIADTAIGRQFMERCRACQTVALQTGPRRALIVTSDSLSELEFACAAPIVSADKAARPGAWH